MSYKGYLIDLDGTMYRGSQRIDGAKGFIDHLYVNSLPYMFITNNSSATPVEVAAKLNSMGIPATKEHVMTSAVATARFIYRNKTGARAFMIGEEGLHHALLDHQITLANERVDYVVIGIDREISYEKLTKACLLIRQGAEFISTNMDAVIPTEKGMYPGNGALTAAITYCTDRDPLFIGKPNHWIMEEALLQIGLDASDVLMVGDNYHTDILAGIHTGIDTLLVVTGFTSMQDLQGVEIKPDYVSDNLEEWIKKQVKYDS